MLRHFFAVLSLICSDQMTKQGKKIRKIPDWKKSAPAEGAAITKHVNGKTYHWCGNHKMWCIHSERECTHLVVRQRNHDVKKAVALS